MRGKLVGSAGADPSFKEKVSKAKRKKMSRDEAEWNERVDRALDKLFRRRNSGVTQGCLQFNPLR